MNDSSGFRRIACTSLRIAFAGASLRMSMICAVPPGRSTQCISFSACTGCVKFLNAARQTMKSKEFSSNGIEAASPCRNVTSTPTCFALSAAMRTKEWLMSSPTIWCRPRFASSIARYPGPGATSRMLPPSTTRPAITPASLRNSARSLPVVRAYQRASGPSTGNSVLNALERALREVSARSVIFSHAVAERVGMNSTDVACLDLLNLMGPMAAGQLAELTGLTTGAITGVIDRLEKSGCARRDRDPNDRRRVIVQPAQGETEREIGPYFSSMARAMAELYARYTDEELALILDFV